ncbi:hypothetical protein ABEY43_28625 [Priestia megaterium]|uniref:hypothetical protein n=1 Tax=Priestia megaterium TaxID=1404 RepID=UPI003D052EF0
MSMKTKAAIGFSMLYGSSKEQFANANCSFIYVSSCVILPGRYSKGIPLFMSKISKY